MKYTKESTYSYEDKNIVFEYIDRPSITQQMKIVDDIVNGVINETVGYEPLLLEYFTIVAFIDNLTNIKLPESFSDSAEFIENAKIRDIVYDLIDYKIRDDIMAAAEKKIKFVKAQMLNKTKLDELFDAIISLINKYGTIFEGVNIDDVLNKFSNINDMLKIPREDLVNGILKYEDSKKIQSVESV